jgi:hypothetical protein
MPKTKTWTKKKIDAFTIARLFCDDLDYGQQLPMDLLNDVAEAIGGALGLDDKEHAEFMAIVNVNHEGDEEAEAA